MLYLLLAFVVTLILLLLILTNNKSHRRKRAALVKLPGPNAYPIIGSIHIIHQVNLTNVFEKMTEFFTTYGPVLRMVALHRYAVISMDTELNEQLLASSVHITKHKTYDILHQWLGVGLLMSTGKKWHSRRKIITPTFHFKILEEFLEIFDRQASVALHFLAKRADGRTAFDAYPYVSMLTLDIIAESAMGTKVNAQTDKSIPYTQAVKEMTAMMAWRFLRVHIQNEITFSLFCPLKKLRQMKLISIMHKFTRNVIEKRRQELESKEETNEESDIGSKKRMALLDLLLQATINGKPLSDEDIREEVDTFMFEGHDTTTSALSFTLHLLARHPQIQNKLLAEIRRVYPDEEENKFTLMNLNELKCMECVIKEVLRLYPSVPIIAREIVEDFKYEHSKLGSGVIPAGTEFMLSLYGMMRDGTRFEDPLEFRPERHEQHDAGTNFAFVPFSAGPRNCVGQKFAMYEMKVILVNILKRFELLPLGDKVAPILNIVMRSETGMQLGLKERM
ncbi:cytochrome P450 4d8 isoform X2 [Musca domestica]|uniref:Cytochrome P450 4d8 isoform X2 n=1 Tax=Musca domestica TaxID=7370 RepID=A0A9J7I1T1_MUSDO|nr:cytochrome P450 4d8 isoform X2 [Musca domestica]